MRYTLDYFIDKFEAIPDDKWCRGSRFNSKRQSCALGHCARGRIGEVKALAELMGGTSKIIEINDCRWVNGKDWGEFPKQRIINYLKHLRDNGRS